ncbi:hypothetical protein TGME49_207920 [Toxoplasma gondii ME49]|uniref:Transmembrane protein n=2 Tax=Toxoplasma gondii TaxID=5811 RepID=A0A125YX78_TOXGV|nr:hypothetical protein TGME49_207920 [Toxoplasma gondii ME49]EPT32423.1 hypothetical protein TGME49_207920 [Toxoplasma gondii ME49]ESS29367.1 putative transmembrane protein [Toxoplasma gondii VEG]|eukprot:XP_018638502.1 hypothetical protein TGME49_207920 [Toxoplasma gondii ME49]
MFKWQRGLLKPRRNLRVCAADRHSAKALQIRCAAHCARRFVHADSASRVSKATFLRERNAKKHKMGSAGRHRHRRRRAETGGQEGHSGQRPVHEAAACRAREEAALSAALKNDRTPVPRFAEERPAAEDARHVSDRAAPQPELQGDREKATGALREDIGETQTEPLKEEPSEEGRGHREAFDEEDVSGQREGRNGGDVQCEQASVDRWTRTEREEEKNERDETADASDTRVRPGRRGLDREKERGEAKTQVCANAGAANDRDGTGGEVELDAKSDADTERGLQPHSEETSRMGEVWQRLDSNHRCSEGKRKQSGSPRCTRVHIVSQSSRRDNEETQERSRGDLLCVGNSSLSVRSVWRGCDTPEKLQKTSRFVSSDAGPACEDPFDSDASDTITSDSPSSWTSRTPSHQDSEPAVVQETPTKPISLSRRRRTPPSRPHTSAGRKPEDHSSNCRRPSGDASLSGKLSALVEEPPCSSRFKTLWQAQREGRTREQLVTAATEAESEGDSSRDGDTERPTPMERFQTCVRIVREHGLPFPQFQSEDRGAQILLFAALLPSLIVIAIPLSAALCLITIAAIPLCVVLPVTPVFAMLLFKGRKMDRGGETREDSRSPRGGLWRTDESYLRHLLLSLLLIPVLLLPGAAFLSVSTSLLVLTSPFFGVALPLLFCCAVGFLLFLNSVTAAVFFLLFSSVPRRCKEFIFRRMHIRRSQPALTDQPLGEKSAALP